MDGRGFCHRGLQDLAGRGCRVVFVRRFRWREEGVMSRLVICQVKLRRLLKHPPTLKKPTDDMTKVGLPVNMHAVYRSAYSRGQFVSQ
jgi:hypothetical protein